MLAIDRMTLMILPAGGSEYTASTTGSAALLLTGGGGSGTVSPSCASRSMRRLPADVMRLGAITSISVSDEVLVEIDVDVRRDGLVRCRVRRVLPRNRGAMQWGICSLPDDERIRSVAFDDGSCLVW